MNKQVYAALSLVCGLLGFNLIAVVQTMAYMQVNSYLLKNQEVDISIFAVGSFYKITAIVLGLLAILLYIHYKMSGDQEARLFAIMGLVLGICSLLLGAIDIWVWFLNAEHL